MEWEEIRSAMVIVAHPDDAEFGSAGTAAKLVRDGKRVDYVVCTDGSKGSSDPEMTPARLTSIRKAEQREAARVTGVSEVCFLDFPDSLLEPSIDLRRAIVASMRQLKPDIVICQNPNRDLGAHMFAAHPDHLAAGEATLAAVYPAARDRMTFPELLEQGLEPHSVKEVWIVGTPAPDFTVDISSTMETKIEALQAHTSQINPEEIGKFIAERAHALGEPAGFEYAEVFKRLQIP